MTAAAVEPGPARRAEHVDDTDGGFLGRLPLLLARSGLTPVDLVALIDAIVRAVWMIDPDFEYAADHDTDGLWAATGRAVRQAIGDAGSNQIEAAMLLGINQPDFSMISRGMGVRTFTLRELAAVADFAGITLAELVSDIERNQR